MNPSLRTAGIALASAALAVAVGVAVAQGQHGLGALLALGCTWLVFSWTQPPRTEAWLLAGLFLGYVIGARGFAQLLPVPGLPLFFGELGLGATLALGLLRGALQRRPPWHREPLGLALLAWLALAAGRMPFDLPAHGLVAARDFATVYYVLFYFVAREVATHEPSRRLLRAALTTTFAVLPVTTVLADLFPQFFLTTLVVQGVPLIHYKEDLATTYGFVGFLWLLPTAGMVARAAAWRWVLALTLLGTGLAGLSRASLLGLLVAVGWLAAARRWRPLLTVGAFCAAGLLAVLARSEIRREPFAQTRAFAVIEAAGSVLDFTGTGHYRSTQSGDKGDNNRFRLVWWRQVAGDTLRRAPLLGLGFGADLARGFVAEYAPEAAAEFNTRSPHNIFVTMLGRLGLAGVLVLGVIYFLQVRATLRAVRAVRASRGDASALLLHALCWVVLVSACFGVVLEGPMGAIPFWILLGLAHQAAAHPADPVPDLRDGASIR